MSNYHTNKIYCSSKKFNLITVKELLNRYHEEPNYLAQGMNVEFFANNLLVLYTKNMPIRYKVIEELSKEFKYCRYDWRDESGYGKKLIFHKGKLQKEYEYDLYTYNQTKKEKNIIKLWDLDLNEIEDKAPKKIELPQSSLPF